MNFRSLALFVSAVLALGAASHLPAQATLTLSATTGRFTYPQTFTSSSTLPTGWFAYTGSGQDAGISTTPLPLSSTTNASSTGAFLFHPSSTSTDYAFGTSVEKGDLTTRNYFGVAILNNTGKTLADIRITGNSEVYGNGNASAFSDFANVGFGASYSTVSWTAVPSLNLSQVQSLSAALSASWAPGATLWLRWEDYNGSAANHRDFAIDDLTVTAVPEPSTYAMLLGLSTLGLVWFRRCSARQ